MQHQVDAGEVRFAVAQRQMIQLAYAQGNIAAFLRAFGREAATGQFQHAGRAVHADDSFGSGEHPFQDRSGAAAQIHGQAAGRGQCLADGGGQIEIAQNFVVQGVPVLGDGVEELACFEGPFLNDLSGHVHVGPHDGVRSHKGHDGPDEVMVLAFRGGGVKDPQSVAARSQQSGSGQDLEMPGDARLPHIQDAYQLVDRQLVPLKNVQQAQPGFVGERFEVLQGDGHEQPSGRC